MWPIVSHDAIVKTCCIMVDYLVNVLVDIPLLPHFIRAQHALCNCYGMTAISQCVSLSFICRSFEEDHGQLIALDLRVTCD